MSQLCRSHKNVSRRWFIYLFITEEYFSPGSKISALVLKNWESFCWYFGLTSAPGSQTAAQVSCFTPRLLYFWSSNRRMTNFIGNLEMISLLQEDQLQAGKTRSLGKCMPLSIYPNAPGPSWCWTWRGQFSTPNLKLSTKATSHSSVISLDFCLLFFTGSWDWIYTLPCLTDPLHFGTPETWLLKMKQAAPLPTAASLIAWGAAAPTNLRWF